MENQRTLDMKESKSYNHHHHSDHSTVSWASSAQMYPKKDNLWAVCPYNKEHKVKPLRLQAHILKCEKVYPKLEICPYNYSHRVSKSEINFHVANCPSKVIAAVEDLTANSNILLYHPKPNPAHQTQQSDSDYECWD